MLWVDAVGGYLVCLADEVVLGQAVPGAGIDIPILGDLSRQHAKVRRVAGDYVLEPLSDLRRNGKVVRNAVPLADGDQVQLGSSVLLRFSKPHALSASAMLRFLSRHRTQPSADGILLMAESCVLGPRASNHIVCPDWSQDLVLYRHDDRLNCRAATPIEIDDVFCEGRGRLSFNSRVTGSDFALSLEEI